MQNWGVQIIVQCSSELTDELLHKKRSPQFEPVHTALRSLGIELQQQHPGITAASLRRYFTAEVANSEVQRILAVLQPLPGINAAYSKAPAEPA